MKGGKSFISAFVAMGARASNQISLIAVTLVATRFLGPADFGIFAIAAAFVTLSRTLLYAGAFEYLMKAPDVDGSASECLAVNMVLAFMNSLVLVGFAALSPSIFDSHGVAALMLMMVPSNFIAAIASWEEALMMRQGRIRSYYLSTMLVEIFSAILAVVMLWRGYGLIALVAQIYSRLLILTLLYRFMAVMPRLRRPVGSHIRTVAFWSSSRYGAVFVTFMSNYSGDLILGALLSPGATGLFRASNRIVTAASDIFTQPARMLALASLSSRFAAGKPADGAWFNMFAGIAFIGWPVLIGVALLADRLAPVALGTQWKAAGPIVAILCVARMCTLLSAVASALLVAYDRQHRVFAIQASAAVGVAALTVALVPMGVIGAALASLLVMYGSAAALGWQAYKVGRIRRADWRAAFPAFALPTATTAIAALAGRWAGPVLAHGPMLQLFVSICFCAAGWAVGALLVRKRVMQALHDLTHQEQPSTY